MNGMEIRVHKEPWSSRVGVMIFADGGRSAARQVVVEPLEDGAYLSPVGYMDQNAAQTLMDNLWSAGLRPSEGSGSAGALAATQRHLDDMRSLVFKEKQP